MGEKLSSGNIHVSCKIKRNIILHHKQLKKEAHAMLYYSYRQEVFGQNKYTIWCTIYTVCSQILVSHIYKTKWQYNVEFKI